MIYAGANGIFDLYEDEGTNYHYERGKFSTLTFTYDDKTGILHIGNRQGAFEGMLARRTFHIVYISPEQSQGLDTTWKVLKTVTYTGKEQSIKLK